MLPIKGMCMWPQMELQVVSSVKTTYPKFSLVTRFALEICQHRNLLDPCAAQMCNQA